MNVKFVNINTEAVLQFSLLQSLLQWHRISSRSHVFTLFLSEILNINKAIIMLLYYNIEIFSILLIRMFGNLRFHKLILIVSKHIHKYHKYLAFISLTSNLLFFGKEELSLEFQFSYRSVNVKREKRFYFNIAPVDMEDSKGWFIYCFFNMVIRQQIDTPKYSWGPNILQRGCQAYL